ncbi:Arylsulfatase precursor [Roseimaritima multifibrata]|uniref:Arylsulfatase n=1 Tax=Roseimaritima multifibrata TaxID=1930274 RepID=A0A517MJD6_9BACT|nr:Arylsulfatase precursor [Roseimaritima multifibrata]
MTKNCPPSLSLRSLLLPVVLAGLSAGFTAESVTCAEPRPNVVFILADDLGWSDTTLYGTTTFYKTPNIERLATRGMTFTHAYASSPLCSPTRSAILTGLSPARTGITTPNCHLPQVILKATETQTGPPNQKTTSPRSTSRLNTDYYTLAEMFKANGYATGHFGKWHLGAAPYSPLEHGFDVDVPHWPGPGPAGSYVAPWRFPDFDPNTPSEHIEDRMASEAVAFMETHQREPFFLNYWMFSVHAPFDAKQNIIDKYRQSVDPKNPQRSPTYAAMIESMDDAVGTLLDTLDRLNIADNTIIVFASDNGGNMYNEVDGTSPTSNHPLLGGKATMYEGGVRGPAIVVDPKRVAANTRSDEVIQSSDFYPTFLERLSIEPQPNQKFDGISIVPALEGKSLNRDAIFTYFPHNPPVPDWMPPAVSVHQDDWKLIRIFHGGEAGAHRYKLFNLADDIGEQNDLSAKHPERVKAMDALIENFLVDTQAARPLRNQKFDPAKYRPEQEGIGRIRNNPKPNPNSKPSQKVKKPLGPPVAGWQPAGTSELTLADKKLIVKSTGGDPYFSQRLPTPVAPQKLTLRFSMISNAAGKGQVFWQETGIVPAYFRDRSTPFTALHDGAIHEYAVELNPKKSVEGIRIDPATGKGPMTIWNIRLTTATGEVLHRFAP